MKGTIDETLAGVGAGDQDKSVLDQHSGTVLPPNRGKDPAGDAMTDAGCCASYTGAVSAACLDAGEVADVHDDDRQPLAVLLLQRLQRGRAQAAHRGHHIDPRRQQLRGGGTTRSASGDSPGTPRLRMMAACHVGYAGESCSYGP